MARLTVACLLVLAVAVAAGACGSDDPAPFPERAASVEGFPAGRRTLLELRAGLPEEQPVLAPTVTVLERGRNRVGFVLYDADRRPLRPDKVALYTATPGGRDLEGPFIARRETLRVRGRFASRQTRASLEELDGFYVAKVDLRARGPRLLTALARTDDDETIASNQLQLRVGERAGPPEVGEPAIAIANDATDTRVPPLPALHRSQVRDLLGRRPFLLVFATPRRCPSAQCAPTLDAVAQVRAQEGIEAIHQEVYRSAANRTRGFRPQVDAWRLPSDLWTFVIDAEGRVAARFEGAASVRELRRAVERLPSDG